MVTANDKSAVWASWCAGAARRATAWAEAELLEEAQHLPPSAAFGDGYAGILASAALGDAQTGAQLLDFTARHWMVSPGEYHLLDEPPRQRQRSLWRSTCLLLAAAKIGRVDLMSRAALERVMSYQHRCGGFFGMDPGQGHGQVEAFTSSWAGRVALRMSWHERARQAALLMAEMLYMQPDPENRFYFVYDSTNSALLTRWRDREPQARYVDFSDVSGESQQMGMVLAFLSEMHLADPGGGWERPLRGYHALFRRWSGGLRSLPALAAVAEGLALASWALPDLAIDSMSRVDEALVGVADAQSPTGSFQPWDCGLGPSYDRGLTAMETTGWTAICLAGASQALGAVLARPR